MKEIRYGCTTAGQSSQDQEEDMRSIHICIISALVLHALSAIAAQPAFSPSPELSNYAGEISTVLATARKGEHAGAAEALEDWLKENRDTPYAANARIHIKNLEALSKAFAALSDSGDSLAGLKLKAKVGALHVVKVEDKKLFFRYQGSTRSTTLTDLPPATVFALFKKTDPENAALTMARWLVAGGEYRKAGALAGDGDKETIREYYSAHLAAVRLVTLNRELKEFYARAQERDRAGAIREIRNLQAHKRQFGPIKALFQVEMDRAQAVLDATDRARRNAELAPYRKAGIKPGTVKVMKLPNDTSYEVFAPPAYDLQGQPLPLLFTLTNTDGGSFRTLRKAATELNMIIVRRMISPTGNPLPVENTMQQAIFDDIRKRVFFDKNTIFAVGVRTSEEAYLFTNRQAPHVAGILNIQGWYSGAESELSRYPGLCIAMVGASKDDVVVNEWPREIDSAENNAGKAKTFPYEGSRADNAPADLLKEALRWIMEQRTKPDPREDRRTRDLADDLNTHMTSQRYDRAWEICINTFEKHPRTSRALVARDCFERILAKPDAAKLILHDAFNYSDTTLEFLQRRLFTAVVRGEKNATDLLVGIATQHPEQLADIYQDLCWQLIKGEAPALASPEHALHLTESLHRLDKYSDSDRWAHVKALVYAANGQIGNARKQLSAKKPTNEFRLRWYTAAKKMIDAAQ